MRIAIVDDMVFESQHLTERIESLLFRRNLLGEISVFNNPEEFISHAKEQPFELVFMDIYMTPTDGLTAAKELRTFDKECILVFTTSSPDHALEGYHLHALQYLVKPFTKEALEEVFDDVAKILHLIEKYIEVKSGRQSVRIKYSEIIWAENYQHQVIIHMLSGETVSTRMTFGQFASSLNDSRFFICNRGMLINLEYATDFDGTLFHLSNGQTVSVSRDLVSNARRTFGEFLFKNDWELKI